MSGNIGEFIAKVIKTLHDHGYPENKVALPLERMYELAAKQGYSFNKVLEFLKEKEGIDHEKTVEKIIFFPIEASSNQGEDFQIGGFDPSAIANMMKGFDFEKLKGLDMGSMMAQAAALLKNLPPEQLQKYRDMFENMSDEEKQDLMNKAKNIGFP